MPAASSVANGIGFAVFLIAPAAIQLESDETRAPFSGHCPGTIGERRLVANVTRVTAGEVGHPVVRLILMKADNLL